MRAVLTFHGVDDSRSVLSIAPAELEGLISAIRATGHDLVLLGALLSAPDRTNCIALTFDDGFASVAAIAAPLLREAGVPATLFLTTGYVGRDNRWPSQPRSAPARPMMSWRDVEELHRDGWEIEAHTQTHPELLELSDAGIEHEVEAPKHEIERRLGRTPQSFAYPYGRFDERVVKAVRAHYRYAVSTRMAALDDGVADPYRIPRIDAFYLRRPAIHARFGSRSFGVFLSVRAALRRWRFHPGETA